jgi:hypothetical protein
MSVKLWLGVHRDLLRTARVRAVVDFVTTRAQRSPGRRAPLVAARDHSGRKAGFGALMKLPRRKILRAAGGAATLTATPHFARAQAYPTRPPRIVAGAPPGGATDIRARLMGHWLSERLG